nr:MetaGeneMark_Unknown Function [uncultured bacterium]
MSTSISAPSCAKMAIHDFGVDKINKLKDPRYVRKYGEPEGLKVKYEKKGLDELEYGQG